MTKPEKIAYEPHPVTPERKAELRGQGFKIIDAIFDPNAKAPAAKKVSDFDREGAFAYLETQGIKPPKNLGDVKLSALVEETKAEVAEKEKAERKAAEAAGSQE